MDKTVQIYCDGNPNAHVEFYDVDWAQHFLDSTHNTPLDSPAFVLCELWKSASNAFRMPYFLLVSLEEFNDGLFRNYKPPAQNLVEGLLANLKTDLTLGLRRMQVERLSLKLAEISNTMDKAMKENPPRFEREAVWRQLSTATEFALGASALREMCHNSLLAGYENYLKQCLDIVDPPDQTRPQRQLTFDKRIVQCFGGNVAAELHNDSIKLAREYRHIILHNGGRVDEKAQKAGIELGIGERVIIPNEAIRVLASTLKDRVNLVTEASIKKIRSKAEAAG